MADEPNNASGPTSHSAPTFYDLMAIVVNSPGSAKDKKGLIRELRRANPTSEKALFVTVVSFLGLMALVSVVAMAWTEKPSDFLPVVTGCIGALSGMLVSRGPSDSSPPRPQGPGVAQGPLSLSPPRVGGADADTKVKADTAE